jgi:hypothetical protein
MPWNALGSHNAILSDDRGKSPLSLSMPRLIPPSGLVRSYSSRQSELYTSQDVSLVVWQITVYEHNLALTAAYGTEIAINDGPGPTLSLLLLMSYTRNSGALNSIRT